MDEGLPMTKSGSRKRQQRLIVGGVLLAFAVVIIALAAYSLGPAWLASRDYMPREGDIIFQSLPRGPVVRAIEGATHSPYSHCGIVGKDEGGNWVVYEALHGVEITPLPKFLDRGRGGGFAVYRLKASEQAHVPAVLTNVKTHLGKPYDIHYDWDDEKIYCSELIYKAYAAATGGELGRIVKFGELDWQPYQDVVLQIESDVPVDRPMITPRDLAKAEQLEMVVKFAIE
jgi:hypothetical protein